MTYFCAMIPEWCFFSGKHHCSVFNALQNVKPAYPYESWITPLCQRFTDSDPNPALAKWGGINRYAVSSYSLRRGKKRDLFSIFSCHHCNILGPSKSHLVLCCMVTLFTCSLLKRKSDTCAMWLLSARFALSLAPLLHLRLPELLWTAVRWKLLANELYPRNEQSVELLTHSSLLSPGNQTVVVSSPHSAFWRTLLNSCLFQLLESNCFVFCILMRLF